jgi:hypothetical protein
MKRFINTIIYRSKLLAIAILQFVLMMTSCENFESESERPDDLNPYITESAVSMGASYITSAGKLSFSLDVHPTFDLDVWRLEITSIDIYLDDTFIINLTQSPYEYEQSNINLESGTHILSSITYFKDLRNNNIYTVKNAINIKISSDQTSNDQTGVTNIFGLSFTYTTYSDRVEITVLKAVLIDSMVEAGWKIIALDYYIDGELIQTGKDNVEDNSLFYVINNIQKGSFVFLAKAVIENIYTNETQSIERGYNIDF